jgi:hypothetical protein
MALRIDVAGKQGAILTLSYTSTRKKEKVPLQEKSRPQAESWEKVTEKL